VNVPSDGSIVDLNATKSVVGQLVNKECVGFQYQYQYNGMFRGVSQNLKKLIDDFDGRGWVLLHLNLKNSQANYNQSVVIVKKETDGCGPCDDPRNHCPRSIPFSTLSGALKLTYCRDDDDIDICKRDESQVIDIKNPVPYSGPLDEIARKPILEKFSNTIYGLFGNRLFLAVRVNDLKSCRHYQIEYNVGVRICESPSVGASLGGFLL
jgi:hypothetical protein